MTSEETTESAAGDGADAGADRREGYIDVIASTGVFGWARDPDRPARKVELEVREGERVLGRIRAEEPRSDLKTAGFGDGTCGFSFYYDGDATPADPQAVTVVFADTGTALNRPNPDEMITAVAQRVENSAQFAVRAAQALGKRAERLETRAGQIETRIQETETRLAETERALSEMEVFVTRIDETLRAKETQLRKEIAKARQGGTLRRVAAEIARVAVAAGLAVALVQLL